VVYEQFAMCSLGCGWLGCAALRLELERWYVGTTVPEGGAFGVVCFVTLCRVGDEVVSMVVVGVLWRRSSRGLASSPLLERPVFAPPIALTASSL
jgi:hypothetical protein